ncbi:hypothetical protein ACSFBX_28730 [Variovorax sp. RB2P76]|uniref:hypothetical protein n=1 Tax=Variovorax sp. RB2P76 TaxID=3443736 RepID=UPI003F487C0D
MLEDLRQRGTPLDMRSPKDRDTLVAYLYQHLVRYTELNVRNAVRLDHAPSGEPDAAHPLANMLAADEGHDPLSRLLRDEEERLSAQMEPTMHQSLAGAYLHLLRAFNNRMHDVADHLMISLSYCYQRCAHARRLAVHQHPIPPDSLPIGSNFTPGAWRRFRLMREPIQLVFDFGTDEVLFMQAD